MKQISKKGNMNGLENAPTIIMIVGLLFLVMATLAMIGQNYGDALDTDDVAGAQVNESATPTDAGVTLVAAGDLKNLACGTITNVYNATGGRAITAANYTQTGCSVVNLTSEQPSAWLFNFPYTFSQATVASNVTGDLNTEISNNTSIAGIILTISLIGIVLAILIGVFMGISRTANRV